MFIYMCMCFNTHIPQAHNVGGKRQLAIVIFFYCGGYGDSIQVIKPGTKRFNPLRNLHHVQFCISQLESYIWPQGRINTINNTFTHQL